MCHVTDPGPQRHLRVAVRAESEFHVFPITKAEDGDVSLKTPVAFLRQSFIQGLHPYVCGKEIENISYPYVIFTLKIVPIHVLSS